MKPIDVIAAKRAHVARLANRGGAAGEQDVILAKDDWVPRPKGAALRVLLEALAETGISIRPSSFDALAIPRAIDFSDRDLVRQL